MIIEPNKEEEEKSFNGYMYKSRTLEFPKQDVKKLDIQIDDYKANLPYHQQKNLAKFSNDKDKHNKVMCHHFTDEVTGSSYSQYFDKRILVSDINEVKHPKKGQAIAFGKKLGKRSILFLHSGIYIGGGWVLQKLGKYSVVVMKTAISSLTYGCDIIFTPKKNKKHP